MAVRKYKPGSDKPYTVSRSRVQLFLDCKRCFYIQNRLGVKMPKMLPFKLNSLVDIKVKQSFDFAREKQEPHQYFKDNKYNLVGDDFIDYQLNKYGTIGTEGSAYDKRKKGY